MKSTVAVIMLTPQCNMRCSYCITENSMGTFSFAQAQELIEYLKEMGTSSLVFGGGEPTLWKPDVFKLMKWAKTLGFITQLGTNAIHLPSDFESFDFVDRWVLPIDGATSLIHQKTRFYQDQHFDLITTVTERLKRARRSVTFSTVMTQHNQAHLFDLANLLSSYQDNHFIHGWHLYQFVPEGREGKFNQYELQIDPFTYDQRVLELKKLNLPFHVFKRPKMLHSKDVAFYQVQTSDQSVIGQLGTSRHRIPTRQTRLKSL